jgi:hypothetical protein
LSIEKLPMEMKQYHKRFYLYGKTVPELIK